MDIHAVAFDVNGTLIKILADDDEERIFRAAAHFLTYQGIGLHRHELREIYFQIMKEQLRASPQKYPEFGCRPAGPGTGTAGELPQVQLVRLAGRAGYRGVAAAARAV